jgi:hypothetical protein
MEKKGPFMTACIKFNKEIVKHHVLKNKNHIITQTYDKAVSLYNIFKLRKIKELPNLTFEKAVEILDSLDIGSQKSWFIAEIKLGTISLIFSKDSLHNNPNNAIDINILEKVLDKFDNIEKLKQLGPKSSNELSGSMKQKVEKMSSFGTAFIQNIFTNYQYNSHSKMVDFFDSNFYDNKGYLKKKYLPSNSIKPESYYYFIYGAIENSFTIGPYINDLGSKFIVPTFIKELIQVPTDIVFSVPKKGEKVEIIIDNTKKEFINKTATGPNYNNSDELEANATVTVGKFKEWLIKAYIQGESFNKLVENDLNQLVSSRAISEKDKNLIIEKYLGTPQQSALFVDFSVKEQVVNFMFNLR